MAFSLRGFSSLQEPSGRWALLWIYFVTLTPNLNSRLHYVTLLMGSLMERRGAELVFGVHKRMVYRKTTEAVDDAVRFPTNIDNKNLHSFPLVP